MTHPRLFVLPAAEAANRWAHHSRGTIGACMHLRCRLACEQYKQVQGLLLYTCAWHTGRLCSRALLCSNTQLLCQHPRHFGTRRQTCPPHGHRARLVCSRCTRDCNLGKHHAHGQPLEALQLAGQPHRALGALPDARDPIKGLPVMTDSQLDPPGATDAALVSLLHARCALASSTEQARAGGKNACGRGAQRRGGRTTEETSVSISPARCSPRCASMAAANARENAWMSSSEAEP